jgi:hypothetical protein
LPALEVAENPGQARLGDIDSDRILEIFTPEAQGRGNGHKTFSSEVYSALARK